MEQAAFFCKRPHFLSYCLVLSLALLLSACASKPVHYTGLEDNDAALLDSYRQIMVDDGIPLTDVEMRALISTGEIDRNLTPEQLREVQIYFKYYVHDGRGVIERFLQRSQPYLDYSRSAFAERGMPVELANLAYIESGYNPLAISRAGAVGMWQFMPSTGKHYGLVQDSWQDERRDPYRSTQAAAAYLQVLHGYFNDWHLAIAAYNAGEGKIGRALQGTGCDDFFGICANNAMLSDRDQLREETMQFVPRFLAMCKIMRNAEALGFKAAAPQPDKPLIHNSVILAAKPNTDLNALAKHLGMSWQEFAAHNPAFLRNTTPPSRHTNVNIPVHLSATAEQALRGDTLLAQASSRYTIVRGDTLGKIGNRFGVSVAELRAANPNCEPLQIGRSLAIPGVSSPSIITASAPDNASAPVAAGGSYTVRSGDTLSQIAERHGVSLSALRAANPNSDPLLAGAKLTIPGGSGSSGGSGTVAQSPARPATYTVASGDTLSQLAEKFGVSLNALRQANPNSDPLRIGTVLTIPGGATTTAPSAPTPATYTVASGDTLSGIAQRFSVSLADLRAANPKSDPLLVGAVLTIPGGGSSAVAATGSAAPQLTRSTQLVAHTVKAGENMAGIAASYKISLGELQAANTQISNPNNIRVGQQLNVPVQVEVYRVQAGDTMSAIAQRFNMSTGDLLSLNEMSASSVIHVGDSIRISKI